MPNLKYNRFPARYAKNKVCIQCPSEDSFRSTAAAILITIAPMSMYWSGRERAYIVSKRTADRFEREIANRVSTEKIAEALNGTV